MREELAPHAELRAFGARICLRLWIISMRPQIERRSTCQARLGEAAFSNVVGAPQGRLGGALAGASSEAAFEARLHVAINKISSTLSEAHGCSPASRSRSFVGGATRWGGGLWVGWGRQCEGAVSGCDQSCCVVCLCGMCVCVYVWRHVCVSRMSVHTRMHVGLCVCR